MKIVVDSNIVFSAILNTQRKLGQILINGSMFFDFYSIDLLKDEILEHKSKIIKISGFNEKNFYQIFQLVTNKIKFINDILISDEEISIAENLVNSIDDGDLLFVALNNYLNSTLWTGDKKLMSGLNLKGYHSLITTEELYEIYLEKELIHKNLLKG